MAAIQSSRQADAVRFSALRWHPASDTIAASPALARCWTEALLRFWRAGLDSGTLDPAQPLYVLDLAPGDGQLAWLMLGALDAALHTAGLALKPVYLACGDGGHAFDRHPCLAPFRSAGRFDCALFDVASAALHCHGGETTLARSVNPVAVLGLAHCASLPAELVALHRGTLLDGLVVPGAALEYRWPVLDPQTLAPAAAPMVEHYRARCCDVALTLPLAACALFDALDRFAGGRSLLLGADPACISDQQVRLGLLAPPPAMPEAGPPPLNLHALQLHQRAAGAATWHHQLSVGRFTLHAAASGLDAPAMQSICAALGGHHPDDDHQLRAMAVQAAASGNGAQLLAALRLAQGDPAALRAALPFLRDAMPALDESARRGWRRVLAETWANYLPLPGDWFHCDAAVLAFQLGSWGLARACLQFGLQLHGDCAHTLYLLAFCEAATGDAAGADGLLHHALALDPAHQGALSLLADIAPRLACAVPGQARRAGLLLEPVGPQHAPELVYQCRDPGIAALTCLPVVNDLEQARAWIAEQQADPLLQAYAVMHEDWGLVGCVSAKCAAADAYFYFWIGTDFQDLGLGQLAASMLFDMLAAQGVEQLFTSAFDDNRRSLHALARLGFCPLDVRAEAPDHELGFLRRGPALPAADAARRLAALCNASGSAFSFSGVPP